MSQRIEPCNLVELQGSLAERGSLRYSPAGVPILSGVLHHGSQQMQAGAPRAVELEIAVVFAGQLAERAERIALGATMLVRGFLAPRRKSSKLMQLNVTEFELTEV